MRVSKFNVLLLSIITFEDEIAIGQGAFMLSYLFKAPSTSHMITWPCYVGFSSCLPCQPNDTFHPEMYVCNT